MPTSRFIARSACYLAMVVVGAALLVAAPGRAFAQVASQGKGTLTLEFGQGRGPYGGIAAQTADSTLAADSVTEHRTAFRFLAGYHFAEQLSVDVGLADLGNYKSSAPYGHSDYVNASSVLIAVEAELTARIPIASNVRVDASAGIAETGLNTTMSTSNGSALPAGTAVTLNVKRFGPTAGLDFEWRLSDVTSVILGYHVYERVGSSSQLQSASGAASALFGGLHFEF